MPNALHFLLTKTRAHTHTHTSIYLKGIELRRVHLRIHQLGQGCEVLLVVVDLLNAQQLRTRRVVSGTWWLGGWVGPRPGHDAFLLVYVIKHLSDS